MKKFIESFRQTANMQEKGLFSFSGIYLFLAGLIQLVQVLGFKPTDIFGRSLFSSLSVDRYAFFGLGLFVAVVICYAFRKEEEMTPVKVKVQK